MRVRLPGLARMSRVASNPSSTGIWMLDQRNVGSVQVDRVDGRSSVLGLGDDVDVGFVVQDHPEPAADQCVIVDDQHPDAR